MTTHSALPVECCENCRYYLIEQLQCRRFPPTPIWNGVEVDDSLPITRPSDWCGEFSLKNNPTVVERVQQTT